MTAVNSMRMHRTQRSWMSLRSPPLFWSSYCRADTVRLTASLCLSLGVPFARRDQDGNGFKRFVTLSMGIFNLIISKLVPIVPRSKLLGRGSESAATSRIWRSRSAGA